MLNERACIVSVNIGKWSAKKKDSRAKEVVEKEFHAKDSGDFIKKLSNNDILDKIAKIESKARQGLYKFTLPWGKNGDRILPAKSLESFMERIRKDKKDFEDTVEIVLGSYDRILEEAKASLNGMFRAEDYPTKEEVKDKYRFEVTLKPLPSSGDFRIDIPNEMMNEMKNEYEASVRSSFQEAESKLVEDILSRVERMAVNLSTVKANGKPPKIFESLIDNLAEIVEDTKSLNLGDNPKIEEIRQEIEKNLINCSVEDLRECDNLRKQKAIKAQEILNKMKNYF